MSALTDLRTAVASAITNLDPDWPVLAEPTDAVAPPCFMLAWGPDPTLLEQTMCADIAQLEVIVIAGRLTTEGAYPIFEAMCDAARSALAVARLRSAQTIGPRAEEFGQVTYLAGRIQIRRPVQLEGVT